MLEALERQARRVKKRRDARRELDERAERQEPQHFAFVLRALSEGLHRFLPGIGDGSPVREPELALVVDAQDLDVDFGSYVEDVGELRVAFVALLGPVAE